MPSTNALSARFVPIHRTTDSRTPPLRDRNPSADDWRILLGTTYVSLSTKSWLPICVLKSLLDAVNDVSQPVCPQQPIVFPFVAEVTLVRVILPKTRQTEERLSCGSVNLMYVPSTLWPLFPCQFPTPIWVAKGQRRRKLIPFVACEAEFYFAGGPRMPKNYR